MVKQKTIYYRESRWLYLFHAVVTAFIIYFQGFNIITVGWIGIMLVVTILNERRPVRGKK